MDHFDKIFEGQGSGSNGSGGQKNGPEDETALGKGYIDPFRIKKTGVPDFTFVSDPI
jgi:hypothetical protein